MADECIFCQVAAHTEPAAIVFEDEDSLAFLDRRPLFPGHCLLIPKKHYETIVDVPDGAIGRLFSNARLLCAAMPVALGAEGSFMAVNNRVSQSVPHLHIHVAPRRKKDGLKGFFWPRGTYKSESELESVRASIESAINGLK